MTDEEIRAIQKARERERRKERDRRWHESEGYKEYNRMRSKLQWQRVKERMHNDPEYREMVNARRRKHPGHKTPGRPIDMTESQIRTIRILVERGYKASSIARKIEKPYEKVYYFIKRHIKTNN